MHRQCFDVSAGKASFLEIRVNDIVSTFGALLPWILDQPFVKCRPGKESIFCDLLPNALFSAWSSFSALLRSQTEYPIVFQQQTGTSQLSKMAEKEVIAFNESNVLLNVIEMFVKILTKSHMSPNMAKRLIMKTTSTQR